MAAHRNLGWHGELDEIGEVYIAEPIGLKFTLVIGGNNVEIIGDFGHHILDGFCDAVPNVFDRFSYCFPCLTEPPLDLQVVVTADGFDSSAVSPAIYLEVDFSKETLLSREHVQVTEEVHGRLLVCGGICKDIG